MSFLILDIETRVDPALYTPPPKEEWKDGKEPFPPAWSWEVLAIGSMLLNDDYSFNRLGILGDGKTEREQLADYASFMNKTRPRVVSWNGRGFDLPVLNFRCMRYGIPLPWFFGRDVRYRYSENGHTDLMDQMMDFGAIGRIHLSDIAHLVGLPGKMSVKGSDVGELWAAGEQQMVKDYCLCDVVQTALIYLRWKYFAGEMMLSTYLISVRQILDGATLNVRTPLVKDLIGAIDRKVLLIEEEPKP